MAQAWTCLLLVVSLFERNKAFVLRGAPAAGAAARELKLSTSSANNHDPMCSSSRAQQRQATALRMAGGDDEQEGPGLSVKAAW